MRGSALRTPMRDASTTDPQRQRHRPDERGRRRRAGCQTAVRERARRSTSTSKARSLRRRRPATRPEQGRVARPSRTERSRSSGRAPVIARHRSTTPSPRSRPASRVTPTFRSSRRNRPPDRSSRSGSAATRTDVNVPYLYAVDRLDCGDTATKSDVGWVFEAAESPQRAANFALGALLFGLGATGTNNPSDCMCGWLTNCQATNNACTFSTSINAVAGCNVPNPVNETTYLDHFCD